MLVNIIMTFSHPWKELKLRPLVSMFFFFFFAFVSQDFISTLLFIHQSFSTVSFHYLSDGINHRGFFFLFVVFKILSFESFWRFKYLWCTPQDLNIQRDEHTWCESAKIFLLSNYSVTHTWFKPLPSIGTPEKIHWKKSLTHKRKLWENK